VSLAALPFRAVEAPRRSAERISLDTIKTDTISVREAAQVLGIGVNFCYELAQRGELPGLLRLGERRLRVNVHALRQYLGAV
jgi:excisionase family DNA binding protein